MIKNRNTLVYLEKKRVEALEAIKPICEAFGIKEYDYLISETGQRETLVLNGQKIGCTADSIDSIIDEVIGYIFICRYCRNRSIGVFSTQTKNVIRQYWIN